MSQTTHEAATYVRTRLRAMESRITQDQMQVLIADLHAAMGPLSPGDAAEVVDVFREIAAEAVSLSAAAAA
jgi:hypothetical protein